LENVVKLKSGLRFAGLLSLAFSSGLAAQNVLVNGYFTSNLSTGWATPGSFAGATFDPTQDCCDDKPEGSVRSVPLNNNQQVITFQCVPFDAATRPRFDFGGWIRVNAVVAGTTSHASLTLQFSSSASCAVGSNVGTVSVLGPAGAAMVATPWTQYRVVQQTTPTEAVAAMVSLTIRRSSASMDAHFDHIFLDDGTLHRSGFETP